MRVNLSNSSLQNSDVYKRQGMESTCRADDSRPFAEQLAKALQNITGQIDTIDLDEELEDEMSRQSIPADPSVKNFSYCLLYTSFRM